MQDEIYYTNNNTTYKNMYDEKNYLVVYPGNSINYRYEIIERIGKGSFSKVYRAIDHKKNKYVAMKIIRHEPRFHKQVKTEIEIFKKLHKLYKNNSNIIHLYKSFIYNGDVFMCFELYGINMYKYYMKNNITDNCVKKISYEVASGIHFLHSHEIIHMDLKPENILVGHSGAKIIDLGSSIINKTKIFKHYIQSRYYRAPEVVFKIEITYAIDIWSYGCILYELIEKTPLIPAKTHNELALYYNHIIGPPPAYIRDMHKSKNYCLSHNVCMKSDKLLDAGTFSWVNCDFELKDIKDIIFNCCLLWDHTKRCSAENILKHSYFDT